MGQPMTSVTHPICVDWIAEGLPGRIGLTFAPGKHNDSTFGGTWERDLAADLDRLVREFQMQVQVCLLEDHELHRLRIAALVEEAERRGVRVHRLPIPDGGVLPDVAPVRALVDQIVAAAQGGHTVVIHCAGGLGRAGIIGGCALVRLGASPDEALEILRTRRSPHCPETAEQRDVIRRFE
jgi:protein-tyrosine phosphatase